MTIYPQNLQLEQGELITAVDNVRDTALDLMSRSDTYGPRVEPELSLLNQRWGDVSGRVKVTMVMGGGAG